MINFGSNNNDKMVFAIDINDNEENVLKITVAPSVTSEKSGAVNEVNQELKKLLENAYHLYPDLNNVYEITFEGYILYQTRNELFCSWDNYEIRQGNTFIIFERSRLLDYLTDITDCCQLENGDYYPGKWVHYGIYTLNHIIDIISYNSPKIVRVNNFKL